MLVLQLDGTEDVQVGDHILITITRIGSNSVRIGVEAPPDLRVQRVPAKVPRSFAERRREQSEDEWERWIRGQK